MTNFQEYKAKRTIDEAKMARARRNTQEHIEAYNLREARKASRMTQVELAELMGVSQNRVSRMENGDIGSMSFDTLRKYIEALGGSVTLLADLPTGRVTIV